MTTEHFNKLSRVNEHLPQSILLKKCLSDLSGAKVNETRPCMEQSQSQRLKDVRKAFVFFCQYAILKGDKERGLAGDGKNLQAKQESYNFPLRKEKVMFVPTVEN